jgi:hypothetical protein
MKVSMRLGLAFSMLSFAIVGCSNQSVERTPVACAPVAQPEIAKVATTAAPTLATPAPEPVAAAKAEPKKKTAATETSHSLSIKRLVVATGMNHKEPEGVATLFRKSEVDKLYAYVEVENDSQSKEQITVSFEPPDGRIARGNVTLDVGSSKRWRTWAFTKNADQVGSWTAVVKDADGRTLARQPFEIAL